MTVEQSATLLGGAFGLGYVAGADSDTTWAEIQADPGPAGALIQILADLDAENVGIALEVRDTWTHAYFNGFCFAVRTGGKVVCHA